jgi:hypothetical protein
MLRQLRELRAYAANSTQQTGVLDRTMQVTHTDILCPGSVQLGAGSNPPAT